MHIAALTLELRIPGAKSLKDKRQVVKSIMDTVRAKFNVSAAEVDHLDSRQSAALAFVVVSNEAAFNDAVLSKIVDTIESEPRSLVIGTEQETL